MIVVTVYLASAISDERSAELARLVIDNIGGTETKGDYRVRVLKGRDKVALDKGSVIKQAAVRGHPRKAQHVWNLVAKALHEAGYAHQ